MRGGLGGVMGDAGNTNPVGAESNPGVPGDTHFLFQKIKQSRIPQVVG